MTYKILGVYDKTVRVGLFISMSLTKKTNPFE